MSGERDFVRREWPKLQPQAAKPKNPGESRTRKLVPARSGGVCERCGIADAETIHHRLKQSQGGRWSPSNCVDLCGDGVRGCHGFIEHNPDAAFAEGFHVRPWCDPKSVVLQSGLHGRVLLTDTGGWVRAPGEGSAS